MDQLISETRDAIGIVTINRPDCMNAMTAGMFESLAQKLQSFADDPAIRAVVLAGSGRAFCAGGDVRDLGTALDLDRPADATRMLIDLEACTVLLHEMPKPTIASVRGAAAGAGLSLALACDFRVVATSAVFTTAFARMGVSGDFGIAYLLTHLVGASRARQLLLCNPHLTAGQADQMGLVHSVVPDDLLDEEVMTLAEKMAAGPTRAFALMKQNINAAAAGGSLETALASEAGHMITSLATEDHREAAAAFLEKREPSFRGR